MDDMSDTQSSTRRFPISKDVQSLPRTPCGPLSPAGYWLQQVWFEDVRIYHVANNQPEKVWPHTWGEAKLPFWVSGFARMEVCAFWNKSRLCRTRDHGIDCRMIERCVVCPLERGGDHGALWTAPDGRYMCPVTRVLHDMGVNVLDLEAVVAEARRRFGHPKNATPRLQDLLVRMLPLSDESRQLTIDTVEIASPTISPLLLKRHVPARLPGRCLRRYLASKDNPRSGSASTVSTSTDVFGLTPAHVPQIDDKRYRLVFIDAASRENAVGFYRSHRQARDAIDSLVRGVHPPSSSEVFSYKHWGIPGDILCRTLKWTAERKGGPFILALQPYAIKFAAPSVTHNDVVVLYVGERHESLGSREGYRPYLSNFLSFDIPRDVDDYGVLGASG